VDLTFLGGVGTVTGSKYLIEHGGKRLLVDCGLFQGYKQLRLRNWRPLPVDPASIDAVLLTHAHIDHSGYLPRLVKKGFTGPIHATRATRDLCEILLPDSGHLQERDAEFANRHGFSKHKPALPLYTEDEGRAAVRQFRGVGFGEAVALGGGLSATFVPAGHILGASIVSLASKDTTVVFSGDLGRRGMATMVDPTEGLEADYLLVESTYGNRLHNGDDDPIELLANVINETVARGGTILIPAFAVGRTQTLLFYIEELKRKKRIADVPVYLDSPMAIDASDVFCAHLEAHRLTADQCRALCAVVHYVNDVEESKALDRDDRPKILISASGMATGGRILHHIKHFGPDPRTTILFAGFQAGGTRGAAMVAGAEQVKIHGGWIPIRAEVHNMDMLSAHADADGILHWLRSFRAPPRHTFITHGEPESSEALRVRIKEELGWTCSVPEQLDHVSL
jgi:metallo-beta-lactamase family protein